VDRNETPELRTKVSPRLDFEKGALVERDADVALPDDAGLG
jgi:hypothetical protein